MSNEKVIDKIIKLLKLSTSNNPNEAAAAAAAAAKLMAEHELDEASIRLKAEESNGEAKRAEPIENTDIPDKSYKKIDRWRSALVGGVASGFGCHVWWEHKSGGMVRIRIIGRRGNVQTARYMFDYLEREVERLCKEGYNKQTIRPVAAAATAWYNSFKLGAASVIASRLIEQRRQMMNPQFGTAVTRTTDGARVFTAGADQGNSQALVLWRKDQEEVTRFYKDIRRHLHLRSIGGGSGPSNGSAFDQGREAGRNVSLGGSKGGLPAPNKQIKA